MSGAHRCNSRSKATNRKKGTHRVAPKPTRQPYNWLGAGAITLGLGAAMASGTGVAAATGDGGSASSSSSASNASSGTTSPNSSGTKGHKPAKKPKPVDTGSSTTPDISGTTASAPDTTPTTKGKKNKPAPAATSSTPSPKAELPKAKANKNKKPATPTAAVQVAADTTNSPAAAPAATSAPTLAPSLAATAQAVNKANPVALAAVSAEATTGTGSSTTSTTPHATSSNPIIAAIQTAMIKFFTTPSTIAQLEANGLTGPTAPLALLNPIGAFLWGAVRGMEDFAGLVPKKGTVTTISDTVTGTVTGDLNFKLPAGGPEMTYKVSGTPLWGSVTVDANGSYTYKSNVFGAALAALGLNPTDTFTVTASSGIASTNQTVTVPVLSSNNTPSAPTVSNQVANNITGVVTGTFNSTSPDGTAVHFSVTQPVQGHLDVDAAGNFTYTPTDLARLNANLGVITTDTFTVTATNEAGNSSLPVFITVPVAPASANTPSNPTVTNQQIDSVTGLVTGTFSSTSPDGTAVHFSVTQPVQGHLVVDSAGNFTYTPTDLARLNANLGVITTDTFTVTASNGSYSTVPVFITVPVAPMDGATPSTPTLTNQHLDAVTGVVTGTISSTNPGGGALTYNITQPVQGHLVVDANGNFTYTPTDLARLNANLGVITTDTFTVTVSNQYGTSGIGWMTVDVSPASANTPSKPTVSNVAVDTVTGVVTGTLTSTSPDGSTVTFTNNTIGIGGSALSTGTVVINGNTFTYTPTNLARVNANLGVITQDTFSVSASNGQFSSGNTTVTVTITPANNVTPTTPTITNQQMNAVTGVVTGTFHSNTPEGYPVTYNITQPVQGSLTVDADGNFTYTPTDLARTTANLGVITTDTFTVTATNAFGTSGIGWITVGVSPASANTPSKPTITNVSQNIYTGVVTGTINSTSPDGSTVTFTNTTVGVGGSALSTGTVVINGNTFTYTPTVAARKNADLNVITSDTFNVTASNGQFTSDGTTVTVQISKASNNTPSAVTVSNQQVNNVTGAVTGTFVSTSPDGTQVSFTYTNPVQGALTVDANGNFTYMPTNLARTTANAGVITTDSFTVTASNSMMSSPSAFITVPVAKASYDTPSGVVSSNQSQNTSTGVVTGTLTTTNNPGNQTLTYSISTGTVGGMVLSTGTVTLANNNGVWTYTYTPTKLAMSNSNLLGPYTDTFKVTVSNGDFSSVSTITVPILAKCLLC